MGPAPAKMWAEWAQSRRRCGHGVSPALAQMLAGVSAGSGVAIASGPEQVGVGPFDLRRATGVPSRSAVPISRPEEIGAGHRAWKLPRRTETSASHGNGPQGVSGYAKRAMVRPWQSRSCSGTHGFAELQRDEPCCMLLLSYVECCCTLHGVRCMLYVACFTLHASRCTLLVVACCALHIVRCMLSVAQCHSRCTKNVACCTLPCCKSNVVGGRTEVAGASQCGASVT